VYMIAHRLRIRRMLLRNFVLEGESSIVDCEESGLRDYQGSERLGCVSNEFEDMARTLGQPAQ